MPGFQEFGGPRRPVVGGIRSQSKSKAAPKWWATRWLDILNAFYVGGRLARGRTYARQGQVMSIDIRPGCIEALVQGSRPTPYKVKITLKKLSESEWKRVSEAISSEAGYAARLLNGDMPTEIEKVFQNLQLSLFPSHRSDLVSHCSCPDDANPCKHIAAVVYLVGEEFERDPFLIFRLRGLEREQLLSSLKVRPSLPPEPLSCDPGLFWGSSELTENLILPKVTRSDRHAALVRQLGNFPFWRGQTAFLAELERIYAAASQRAQELKVGSRD